MTALTAGRATTYRSGIDFSFPVAEATEIFKGGIVALNTSGYAVPGAPTSTLVVVGYAKDSVDNKDGGNGDLRVEVHALMALFVNSGGGDEITLAHVGDLCYVVDDQTVALTSSSGTRPIAGVVADVGSEGVSVLVGDHVARLAGGSSPAVVALQARRTPVFLEIVDLTGASPKYAVAPIAGTINKIYSIIDGALATGDATLTPSINGVAITGGAITITQAGSAAGDLDESTPTAANTVAAGDKLSIAIGGTNSAARRCQVLFLILPS